MQNEINNSDSLSYHSISTHELTAEEVALIVVAVLLSLGLLYWIFTSSKPTVPLIQSSVSATAVKSALSVADIAGMLHG